MDAAPLSAPARHPFRAGLPARVLRRLPVVEPEVARALAVAAAEGEAGPPRRSAPFGLTTQDIKDFLLAYTACLLAALTFIG